MTVRNLASFFQAQAIAIVGPPAEASGRRVIANLQRGGYQGTVVTVDPGAIADLAVVPQLGIVCTPGDGAVGSVRGLARKGCPAAIVLTEDSDGQHAGPLRAQLATVARQERIRILGPSTLGVIAPAHGMNASTMAGTPHPGRVAFVSQSASVASAVLDWAGPREIGFSHFITLGEAADVDFGDLLDYLGSDPATRAILLYIESIRQRRNFMSAARAAARNKPVLAIKAGRSREAARAAATHTGVLAGSDAVYDATFSRAGMLRVQELDEMFSAVETLARVRPPRGSSLAILSNGGGIAVMAVDELDARAGDLATLSADTVARLDATIGKTWSGANPIDIRGDAGCPHYAAALTTLMQAPEVDAVLVMNAPTGPAAPLEIAQQVIATAGTRTQNKLMTCWVGNERAEPARQLLREAGLPAYETPVAAIRAFTHLLQYRRNQDMLMETPTAAPTPAGALATARAIVDAGLAAGRRFLAEMDARAILVAYGIPFVESHDARSPADAARVADRMAGPVAVKVVAREVVHKSDVGGVLLNLQGAFEVEKACHRLLDRLGGLTPNGPVEGFTVQRMANRPYAQEIIMGMTTDPVFGPVIMFGQGGTAVDILGDFTVGLPPLNTNLARALIHRTRIARLLAGYRDHPAANLDAICTALIMVAQLIIDIPEISELDINPLFADADGVLAVDCRIGIGPPTDGRTRLAIRPYPKGLEETIRLKNGTPVLLRPIRPEDEPKHHAFVANLSPEDKRFRFFGALNSLQHSEMARLTQIDYDREMAFIAVDPEGETLGVVRGVSDPDNDKAEFAVATRSDLQRSGLGRALMEKLIRYCKSRGTNALVGQVLSDNVRMLDFTDSLGFRRSATLENGIAEIFLDLTAQD